MEDPTLYRREFVRALVSINRQRCYEILEEFIASEPPLEAINKIITPALQDIGDDWQQGKAALTQVYMSGRICEDLINHYLPPQSTLRTNQPVMAIGVFEDFHLLGKRIVYLSLRACGFQLVDLGAGLTREAVIHEVNEKKIEILLLSVLMLPSALHIKALREALPADRVKIVVGGAPFRIDPDLSREVGADFYGYDSSDAINIIRDLTGAGHEIS
jgi:methanogenic corrinoid protein MtbC1